MTTAPTPPNRRPLKTRDTRWARVLSKHFARRRISPDAISLLSVFAAAIAGAALWRAGRTNSAAEACALFIVAGVCIQARLLCNMLDGMIAVESGRQSSSGEICNDLPDRVADVLIFVGAGYAIALPGGATVGWFAATLAVMTAYVRVLGRSIGTPSYFVGPMAKPHRMAALTVACALAALAVWWGHAGRVMAFSLGVIAAASAWTCVRRLMLIRAFLRGGGA